jgi:hypothetical protein
MEAEGFKDVYQLEGGILAYLEKFPHEDFEGVNILDKNASRMNDKATSTETGGGANGSFTSPGFSTNQNGVGKSNSTIFSYQTAVKILTDSLLSQHNLLAIPGIREAFVTDYAGAQTKEHTLSMYVMDIPYYDFNGVCNLKTFGNKYINNLLFYLYH